MFSQSMHHNIFILLIDYNVSFQPPAQAVVYPSECPMSAAENGSLLVNTPNDVNPLNMVILFKTQQFLHLIILSSLFFILDAST